MKQNLFVLIVLFSTLSFAEQDVCCIFNSKSGDSVQTFNRIVSSSDCKPGGTYQGKSVCASVPDPENTYCSSESRAPDRCGKCGYFWSGKECLTQNPVDKAKQELKEEDAKKKEVEKKDGAKPEESSATKTGPTSVKTKPIDAPAAAPANPDEDQPYNKKPNNKTKGLDSYQ